MGVRKDWFILYNYYLHISKIFKMLTIDYILYYMIYNQCFKLSTHNFLRSIPNPIFNNNECSQVVQCTHTPEMLNIKLFSEKNNNHNIHDLKCYQLARYRQCLLPPHKIPFSTLLLYRLIAHSVSCRKFDTRSPCKNGSCIIIISIFYNVVSIICCV